MSNLGGYQDLVVDAKQAGGPDIYKFNLKLEGGFWGAIITLAGVLGVFSIRALIRKARKKKESNQSECLIAVTSSGTDGSDLEFIEGDSYHILYADEETVLIEKNGDTNNPYIVSPDFLRTISDYS